MRRRRGVLAGLSSFAPSLLLCAACGTVERSDGDADTDTDADTDADTDTDTASESESETVPFGACTEERDLLTSQLVEEIHRASTECGTGACFDCVTGIETACGGDSTTDCSAGGDGCDVAHCILRCIRENVVGSDPAIAINESGLSDVCLGCYTTETQCGLAGGCAGHCLEPGPECDGCLCEQGCVDEFISCAGILPTGDCD